MRRSITPHHLLFCLLAQLGVGFFTAHSANAASDLEAVSRGLAVLEDPRNAPRGDLRVNGRVFVDEESMASIAAMNATIEAHLDLFSVSDSSADLQMTVSVVLAQIDGDPIVLSDTVSVADTGASQWVYRREIELPEDFLEAAVVLRTPSGSWGATGCSFVSGEPTPQPSVAVHSAPSAAPATPSANSSPGSVGGTRPSVESSSSARREPTVIRLLPPRKRPAVGRTKLETLVAAPTVDRVVFFLDGRKVGADDEAPFSAHVELGETPREHTVRVSAYAAGSLVGNDQMLINETKQSFEIFLQEVKIESGTLKATATVNTLPGQSLDRVEFLVNDEIVATQRSQPFALEHAWGEVSPSDYVSVRAWAQDGEVREDARLLTDSGPAARVDVNLVEVFAVVTDGTGRPIEGLREQDFTIEFEGDKVDIESFAYAEDVPLMLGLIIDTSESMWALMEATKRAGSRFLASTMTEGDRAFLVDFDTQPRLAHGTTASVQALMRAFSALVPDGFTAIYDALLFSLLQFEEIEDRRALVLLTDGDDVKSQYGRRRVIEYCRELGVPAYFIGLQGIQSAQAQSVPGPLGQADRRANRPVVQRKLDLEGIAKATGGRVHYISRLEELDSAYDQINAELRNQYILTFSTDRALTDAEVDKIKLKVARRGLTTRIAVGRR